MLGPNELLWWGAEDSRYPETADLSFYDKTCSIRGGRGRHYPDNAPNANLITLNDDGLFRDGEYIPFTPTYYFPLGSETVVQYNDELPDAVSVNLWRGSTPYGGAGFQAYAEDVNGQLHPLLGTENEARPTNFSDFAVHGRYYGSAGGKFLNKMWIRGFWASDRGKPVTLAVMWTWRLPVSTLTFHDRVGWGGSGGSVTYEAGWTNVPISVSVVSDSTDSSVWQTPAFHQYFEDHTGSGSNARFDLFEIFGTDTYDDNGRERWRQRPDDYSPFYYSARFIRATAS